MTRKVVKGSGIADLLAENPINDYEALDFEFPDENINTVSNDAESPNDVWEMYFDGVVNLTGNGIGAVLVALDGRHFAIAVKLSLPGEFVTDNAKNLNGPKIQKLCDQYKIRHLNSSPYRPQMNGAVEASNKNLKRIIGKMTITYKDWHDMLPFALHAYRTTVRTSTEATPYSLVYGMEVVLPIEVEIPSLRILKEAELDETEWVQSRLN
ncbi:uncharacterized protein LOC131179474 [Hevea brasiliensis]|uniref:uncharacterized protein LOC131179474 n=1 Tax=Hevea brasiliensis TaxID=3981 RepID=UPI0025EDFB3D|nr:uncharacterized protein LOC131179474 [Hevea brasiliensis]